MSYILLIVQVD